MISLFGNPEPTFDSASMEDVARTDTPLAVRRLAEMLEEDAAARERQESGAIQELDRLPTRLREGGPATSRHAAPAGSPHTDRSANPWIRSTTILR